MGTIEGNTEAIVQICRTAQDEYGADRTEWKEAFPGPLTGVLDMTNAGTSMGTLMKRVEDSDYIFLCDYFEPISDGRKLTAENSRLVIDNEVYEVRLYDDVMRLHGHMEIYLKYLGGQ